MRPLDSGTARIGVNHDVSKFVGLDCHGHDRQRLRRREETGRISDTNRK